MFAHTRFSQKPLFGAFLTSAHLPLGVWSCLVPGVYVTRWSIRPTLRLPAARWSAITPAGESGAGCGRAGAATAACGAASSVGGLAGELRDGPCSHARPTWQRSDGSQRKLRDSGAFAFCLAVGRYWCGSAHIIATLAMSSLMLAPARRARRCRRARIPSDAPPGTSGKADLRTVAWDVSDAAAKLTVSVDASTFGSGSARSSASTS